MAATTEMKAESKTIPVTPVNHIFVVWYRNRFRPTQMFVEGVDLPTVRQQAQDYCERFNLRFISVHPFITDLTKNPDENSDQVNLMTGR